MSGNEAHTDDTAIKQEDFSKNTKRTVKQSRQKMNIHTHLHSTQLKVTLPQHYH